MVRVLPTTGLAAAAPFKIESKATLVPAMRGPVQELVRGGSRWGFQVQVAALKGAAALPWHVLHRPGPFLLDIPQPGVDVGSPGSPVVDGAGQTGTTLAIRGGSASYAFTPFQFISIISGGQRYTYQVVEAVTLSALGAGSLSLEPELRGSLADGDVVEVLAPKIEGFVKLPRAAFRLDAAGIMSNLTFTIEERQ